MQGKDVAYNKWSQPGWRIEQTYSNKVLVGNWAEERLQFTRECKPLNTTHRQDFRPQSEHKPDVIVRRTALRRSEGLPSKILLSHHDTPTSHYLLSLYDESYGRRVPAHLPAHRTWHSDKLAWVPERSDHPITDHRPRLKSRILFLLLTLTDLSY
ncbi:cilia- and flagella-associated protein 107 isoform X2 [Brachyhypopomus gauderio]|uniref:cilia- and flagella-associated protein 107 isoform X2 n=1 Tax=Brachyhypopomus gauderio TaxID=698409 RepID=UPI004042D752